MRELTPYDATEERLAHEAAIDALPDLLRWFAAKAGYGAALALAQDFGGRSIFLPSPDFLKDDHPLVETLGMTAAKILCRDFGPESVEVPLGPTRKSKKQLIAEATGKGYSDAKLARLLGTTERHVRRSRAELGIPTSEDQMDLFPPDKRPG